MIPRLTVFLALFSILVPTAAFGQCQSNAQAEATSCGSAPVSVHAWHTCGNCTHNWTPAPASGQGTSVATYQYNYGLGFGTRVSQVSVSSYDPNVPCSTWDAYQILVGMQPNLAPPALSNGPWNGDTSKVWVYTRHYYDPQGATTYILDFFPSWTVTGGIKLSSVNHQGNIFWDDTVRIKWTGASAMSLIETQSTYHANPNMIGTQFCNWSPVVHTPTYPSLAVFNNFVCTGTAANFFTFPYAGSTYTWSVTNGTVVGGQGSNSAQIIMSGPGVVSVQRDSSGILTNATLSVTPMVAVMNLGPDLSLCAGSSTTLSASSGFSSYQWSTGATTQNITVSSPGTYSVTGTINGGCATSDTIVVNPFATVFPNLGPDVHTCTFPVTLDAGPGFTSYAWNVGGTTQTINVGSGGTYSVTTTDANGCTGRDTISVVSHAIYVNLGPDADYCYPGSVTLNAGALNATSWSWSTGATTPSITLSALGAQTVHVTATNTYGCQDVDTVTKTGIPRPTPNLGPDQTVCPGTTVVLNPGSGFASYLWTPFATTPTLATTTAGTYRVRVTAANGCTANDTVVISHYPFVAPNLGPDINVCQPSATLDAGPGYSSYSWNTGATTQTISVTSTGNYSVTVVGAGGCTDSDTIQVSFAPLSFSLGPDQTVCEPQVVTLDPQLLGNFNYTWSTGATSPTLALMAPGTYLVDLIAANGFGCIAYDTVSVTILPTPPLWLGSDTLLCRDTSLTLDASAAFASYLWNTGATTQSIALVDTGGMYWVLATAANGCTRQDSIHVTDMIDCVFPGDVNYDGVADLTDVLALGTSLGHTGSARINPSTAWYGQWTTNWSGMVVSNVNRKQADTDGNGTIAMMDTVAIHNNLGQTHARVGTIATGDARVRIVPMNSSVPAGGTAIFTVLLEDLNGGSLDSIHGLALDFSWPTQGILGLQKVNWGTSWFAPANNRMLFHDLGNGHAGIVVSRTSATDTSGHGAVMRLEFATDPNNPASFSFSPTVTSINYVGMNLNPHGATPVSTPATILGAVNNDPLVLAHARISPIPASNRLNVEVDGQYAQRVQLVNMMGQVVVDMQAAPSNYFILDVSELPAGNYCVQIQTETGLITKKVIVAH